MDGPSFQRRTPAAAGGLGAMVAVAGPGAGTNSFSALRHSPLDALFIALAAAHGWLLSHFPSITVIALGLWCKAKTVAHNFIHLPFFRSRTLNTIFSAVESLVLGIPQRLWRDRHLAHHADRSWRWRWSRQLAWETGLVATLWSGLLALEPEFFLTVYLPGWFFGLALCHLQGHFEHKHGTKSHYGRLYNLLFFNDGYHAEHHARPAVHWSLLKEQRQSGTAKSRWPAVLRGMEYFRLDGLERLVLRSKALQRFVLGKHERAFRALLPRLGEVRRVGIVGGGIFPRTALILHRLLPDAHLTIIDARVENLCSARRFVDENVRFVHGFFEACPHGGWNVRPQPGPTGTELNELRLDKCADSSPLPAVLGSPEGSGLKSALLNSMAVPPGPAHKAAADQPTSDHSQEGNRRRGAAPLLGEVEGGFKGAMCVNRSGRPPPALSRPTHGPLEFDLVVIPLAFIGDRSFIYRRPPAPAVLVHDWLWRRRGTSVTVSLLLLKQLNLVKRL